jgi:hypothetical protein
MIVCSIIFGSGNVNLSPLHGIHLVSLGCFDHMGNTEVRREESEHGSHLWKFISKSQIQGIWFTCSSGLGKGNQKPIAMQKLSCDILLKHKRWTVVVGSYASQVPTNEEYLFCINAS